MWSTLILYSVAARASIPAFYSCDCARSVMCLVLFSVLLVATRFTFAVADHDNSSKYKACSMHGARVLEIIFSLVQPAL